jgi:AcrR family transcriptional regulator
MVISARQLEIISAAGRILTESGVSGLTIKKLALEMKWSESALYRHYSSKEEIILSLLDYLAHNMDERLSAREPKTDIQKDFLDFFGNQLKFFSNNPHFVVAVFSDGLWEESKRVNESINTIMQVKMKHLKKIIQKGQKEGVFITSLKSDVLVHIVVGTFRLQMYQWRISNFEFDIKKKGDKIMRSVLKTLLT